MQSFGVLRPNGTYWLLACSMLPISRAASQAFGLLLVCHWRHPVLLEVERICVILAVRFSAQPPAVAGDIQAKSDYDEEDAGPERNHREQSGPDRVGIAVSVP